MFFLLLGTMKESIEVRLHKKTHRRNDVVLLSRNQSTTAELWVLISTSTSGLREPDAAIKISQNLKTEEIRLIKTQMIHRI